MLFRDSGFVANRAAGQIDIDDPVDHLEIFKAHLPRRSGALGRDQFVDAGAKILEDEILFLGRLTVVDLLGPLLERQLDAESLVDGKAISRKSRLSIQIVDGIASSGVMFRAGCRRSRR